MLSRMAVWFVSGVRAARAGMLKYWTPLGDLDPGGILTLFLADDNGYFSCGLCAVPGTVHTVQQTELRGVILGAQASVLVYVDVDHREVAGHV